jgi:hypothetical protein
MLGVYKFLQDNFEQIHQKGYGFAQLNLKKLSIYTSYASPYEKPSADIKRYYGI